MCGFFFLLLLFLLIVLEGKEERDREVETSMRKKNQWQRNMDLAASCTIPSRGHIKPATQAYTLTGYWTCDFLVPGSVLNHLATAAGPLVRCFFLMKIETNHNSFEFILILKLSNYDEILVQDQMGKWCDLILLFSWWPNFICSTESPTKGNFQYAWNSSILV